MTPPIGHSLVRALHAVPEFATLDDATLLEIVGASATLMWRAGSVIFQPGEASEALYIVLSGRVRVLDGSPPNAPEVAALEVGQHFGEASLLRSSTHTRTAIAAEDTELLVLPKASFEALLAANPALAERFRQA